MAEADKVVTKHLKCPFTYAPQEHQWYKYIDKIRIAPRACIYRIRHRSPQWCRHQIRPICSFGSTLLSSSLWRHFEPSLTWLHSGYRSCRERQTCLHTWNCSLWRRCWWSSSVSQGCEQGWSTHRSVLVSRTSLWSHQGRRQHAWKEGWTCSRCDISRRRPYRTNGRWPRGSFA